MVVQADESLRGAVHVHGLVAVAELLLAIVECLGVAARDDTRHEIKVSRDENGQKKEGEREKKKRRT